MPSDIYSHHAGLYKERRELEAKLKALMQELETSEAALLEDMQTTGKQSVNAAGVTMYLNRKIWASALDVEVLANDPTTERLVKPTCNGQTLSAWVREQDRDADDKPIIPEHLQGAIKVSDNYVVGCRKSS